MICIMTRLFLLALVGAAFVVGAPAEIEAEKQGSTKAHVEDADLTITSTVSRCNTFF